jgi:hypothetical protein
MTTFKFVANLVFCTLALSNQLTFGVQIVCNTDVSNTRAQLVIQSTNDIYSISKIDLSSGFRLAGQYLPNVNKFKLYVYDYSKDRHVLLSTQEFDINPKSCEQSFGKNRVYGEPYERELYFQCHQDCK